MTENLQDMLTDTPAVVVDRTRLMRNLERVQQVAQANQLALWPHIKTHKCVKLATLQVSGGAEGLSVAKPGEAIAFMEAGFRDILVAYPGLSEEKVRRLLVSGDSVGASLTFTADSLAGVEVLGSEALRFGRELPVMLKIDVGLHRCGIDPDATDLPCVAQAIDRAPGLRLAGILSHAGHSYAASSPASIRKIAAEEKEIMLNVADRLIQHGTPAPLISVGSTPTVLANAGFEGIGQIRPGNYVFCDLTQVRLGLVALDDVALFVLARVVSRGRDWVVIDAGSKTLSSDTAPHSAKSGLGYGIAFRPEDPLVLEAGFRVERLSEEHGVVADQAQLLKVGDLLRVFPNHACPVMNLTDRVLVAEGMEVVDVWPIDARSRSR